MIYKRVFKRLVDIFLSIIGLLILLPIFIIIAIIIKIDSKGAIIYKANRVGKNEKNFQFYKFRTMYPNSSRISITVGEHDPRITKVGYYLRKMKLDEIPQLINVLIGDISIVGPRPDVEEFKEFYKKYNPNYYQFKPGITSYSSIFFRSESTIYVNDDNPKETYINYTIPKKVELDSIYFSRISLKTDLNIIFKTLYKIIKA